ncbi:6-hydroxymethylpterin diphosphokinase MptE-like protein [Mahella sp.]|uniref:motility associated factor glycosyltransferase family protein n=1 Tax=Mahella sp. TaxID=2798721 RepID=UPI0025C3D6E4|nr:6-hydroxymethylpterin diphosphokinase MptE-like protein [Mahella sp.]MBZ4666100.1 hypothetical protein [Mahella sp.]
MDAMQWLKDKFPRIYEKVKDTSRDDYNRSHILPAKLGGNTLQYECEDKKIFMHSSYDPVKEAKRWADAVDLKPDSVVIVYGMGLGYHVDRLLERMSDENRLLIVEPSVGIFLHAIEAEWVRQLLEDKRVFISVADDIKGITFFLSQYIAYNKMEHCVFVDFGPYSRIFGQHYKDFTDAARDVINAKVINRNTLLHYAAQWQDNFFASLPYALQSIPIGRLFDKFIGKPVVIVSAGPSLNKNMHLLNEIKDKALILCVGTALKALLKEDIVPDMVISVDGSLKNYDHFKEVLCRIPLAYSFTLHPSIVESWEGPRFIMNIYDPMSMWLEMQLGEPLGTVESGPSVANVAFSMALHLKAEPIILIGQDLAYSSDGHTHAQGTMYEKDKVKGDSGNYRYVEGIDGQPVLTSPSFLSFLTWFENAIQAAGDRAEVIDATEGGAKIHGTRIMTFKDAIDQYCRENIHTEKVLSQTIEAYEPLDEEKIGSITKKLEETLDALKEIKRLGRNGIRLSEKLLKVYQDNKTYEINRILKRLDDIDAKIKEDKDRLAILASILELVTFKVMEGYNENAGEDRRDTGMRVANRSKALYEGFNAAIIHSLPHLEQCIAKIKAMYGLNEHAGDHAAVER